LMDITNAVLYEKYKRKQQKQNELKSVTYEFLEK